MSGGGRRRLALTGVLLCVVAGGLAAVERPAGAAAGALDPSFGGNGTVTTDAGAILRSQSATPATQADDDEATAAAVLGDGRIVVAGFAAGSQTNGDEFVVARYGTDGGLDPAFGTGGLAATDFGVQGGAQARAVAVQTDGRIVVAGRAGGDFALARYLPDGTADSSFGEGVGRVTTNFGDDGALAVAVEPGGRIVAAGYSTDQTGGHRFTLVGYQSNGSVDDSFGPGVRVVNDFGGTAEEAHALALLPGGDIVVAGSSQSGETVRFVAARYTAGGARVSGFGAGETGAVVDLGAPAGGPGAAGASALAAQPDGAVLLAGAAPLGNGDSRTGFAVVRLGGDGRPDPAFGTGGVVHTAVGDESAARGVAVTADGRIVAAGVGGDTGAVVGSGGAGRVAVVRYDRAGVPDPSFGAGGVTTTAIGQGAAADALALQPDGKAVVAGLTRTSAGSDVAASDFALARYLADPAVSIGDLRIGEGDTGTTEGRFTVALSAPAGGLGARVHWATADGTAVAPADYEAASGTVDFAPGELEKTVSVLVHGDRRDTANRLFFVDLTDPEHATLSHSRAVATIVDDEPLTADTVAGGPGLVARLAVSAPEGGALLQQLCLDPRRGPCVDLTAPPGPGPNPRISRGVTFQVEDADGVPAAGTQVDDAGGQRGLRTGAALEIWLPDGVGAAELRLVPQGSPVTVEAFAPDGTSLGAAATTVAAGQPESLRLPATPAVEVPQQPFAVAAAGNLVYVADPANHRLRLLDLDTRSGCPCETAFAGSGAAGDPAEGADPVHSPLAGPYAVSPGQGGADGSTVYIADTFGHRLLRAVTTAGTAAADPPRATLTTIAGTGAFGFAGDGAAARQAQLNSPYGVARDSARNLTYLADTLNHRIRAVRADGTVATVAGTGTPGYAGDGGPAVAARLDHPRGLALDGAGGLFIADTGNDAVRRFDPATGIITTVAGNGTAGFAGDGGPAAAARLDSPAAVAVDSAGDLFVADTGNQRIRRVDLPGATITTVAGNGTAGFGGDGGAATRARLHSPFGVAVTAGGDVVVADSGNNRVRIVRAGSGVIDTVAGNGAAGYAAGSWPAALAPLAGVASVAAWDPGGSETRSRVFLADPFTHSVRQVDERGRVTTVVGNGSAGGGDGQLANPFGVATDRASPPRFLYVADTFNHRIQRVDLAAGTVSTAAGTGQPGDGGDGGPAGRAQLSFPTGISVDAAGDLYIADTYNARIRRVDAASGVITTVAGSGRLGSGGDGGPAVGADLFFPHGVATSGADPPDLYVADTFNNRVRRVDGRTGTVTTVAGDGTPARLDRPWGVAVDDAPHPDVYIADTGNGVLRRLDGMSAAVTKFLPGTAPLVDFDPGQPLTAGPRGVAVPRHVTGGEVNPAPGKLVLVADSRGSRAARAGLALADPSAAAVAFQTTSFDLGCGAGCPTQTIDVTNPGSATLAVRQVVIRGDQAGDFRVTADGCSRRAVPPGQRCRLRLAFSPGGTCPTTDPCRQAQLAITTNGADGDHVVLLAGSAVRQGPDMRATTTATNSGVGTVTASDDATVSPRRGGPVPSGTATFFLCGPLPSAAGCPAGGNAVGPAKTLDPDGHAVSDSTPVAAPANQEAEYWCWRAEYSGDVFYLPALHTDTTGQCFGVLPGGFVLSP